MSLIKLNKELADLQLQFNVIDFKVKHEERYISCSQLKVFRKRRTQLRKAIKDIQRKIDLLTHEPIRNPRKPVINNPTN